MQRIFEKWLLLYTVIACIISFGLSLHTETKEAQSKAVSLISQKINDTQKLIAANDAKVNDLLEEFVSDVCLKMEQPSADQDQKKQKSHFIKSWGAKIRENDLKNFVSVLRVGDDGEIIVCRKDLIVGSVDESALGKSISFYNIPEKVPAPMKKFYAEIQGKKSIVLYKDFDNFRIFGFMTNEEMYRNLNSIAGGVIAFHIVLFVIAYVIMILLVRRVIINGIYKVNNSLTKITQGDLNETVEVKTNREMTLLSDGINTMLTSLKTAMSEKEAQINRELELGRKIQRASLPSSFPAFPGCTEFDLYASMEAAKEVGGDFYDFFLIDDNHICVVIGDVSGKGVPAALFMMRTKVMIRDMIMSGLSVSEAFSQCNKNLCENNETGMFVTAFAAVLEITTGKITCVNAGHNRPLLLKKNSFAEWIFSEGGLMLAAFDGMEYKQSEFYLNSGDTLYIYTDGVTEAFSDRDEIFGDARLQKILSENNASLLPLKELINYINNDIAFFVGTAKQSDDITMLALRYFGHKDL